MTKENKPVHKVRVGSVTGTVWLNQAESGVEYASITLERSYKDDKDQWHTTNSYGVNDLPRVELVARECFAYVARAEWKQEKE